jgi:hypothetical protein
MFLSHNFSSLSLYLSRMNCSMFAARNAWGLKNVPY